MPVGWIEGDGYLWAEVFIYAKSTSIPMLRAPCGANTASCSGASQARESESRRELSQPRLGLRRPTDLLQAKVQRSGEYRNMEKYAQKVSEN